MTIVGTRPEIIRLSRTMALLDASLNHVIVHTGQNYDYELNQIFFSDLELRQPDHFLGIDTTSIGTMLGTILIKAENVILSEKPDAVLILGDTNSSLAAIVAKRHKIPIYHMEAGNRCFDLNVPEEINRRIIDHIADFNLVYTEHARRHLLSEGLPHRRIYLTGSPMKEVLDHYAGKIEKSAVLNELGLIPSNYFIVSIHRQENVDDPDALKGILATLDALSNAHDLPIIVSTHPRTQKRIASLGSPQSSTRIRFLKPFAFSDYIKLQQNALCTISDSGTISEEASILSFPAITVRNAMERPEAMDSGSIILTGLRPDTILACIRLAIRAHEDSPPIAPPSDYCIGDTSWRVLKIISGTARLSNSWAGIRVYD
jgi:UDP-N-acetylglucosamine 2-epimerase (non-hydrolysing)